MVTVHHPRASAPRALDRDEEHESRTLVQHAFAVARSLGIHTLLVQAHTIPERRMVEALRETERVIWVAGGRPQRRAATRSGDLTIALPGVALTRLSQLNLVVFLAVLNRHIDTEERVLVLSGVAGSRRLDTLVIVKPLRDYPWLKHHAVEGAMSRHIVRTLEIALRLAREGREGVPIGTLFVLGDPAQLAPYLRQLILNPLKGHVRNLRSVHHPGFLETLRELAAVDGAFIVNRRGIVDSAGTYVDAPLAGRRLSPGLGARHAAALAITTVTDAMAVAVSASSGTVSVYEGGDTVLELERA